jgi:TonB family protein
VISRFIALSIMVHAVVAGVSALHPSPVHISIDVPALDVSFASSRRTRPHFLTPESERVSVSKVSQAPKTFETIKDGSNKMPESAVEIASTVVSISPRSGGPSNPRQLSPSPRAVTDFETTRSLRRSTDFAAIVKDTNSDNYNDIGEAERANHLISQLHGALDRRFIYPPLARRHGWEGTVQIGLHLDMHGQLGALRVVRSSGYAILDDDAIKTLKRVGSIPRARAWLDGRAFETELTVIYRLIES